MPNRKQNMTTNLVAASIIALMLFLSPSNAAITTHYKAGDARDGGRHPVSVERLHICDRDCNVLCLGDASCTYRTIQCGTDKHSAKCFVQCDWDHSEHNSDMWTWLDMFNDGVFGAEGDGHPYPPCNHVEFVVKPGSELSISMWGKGAMALSHINAEAGSTVMIGGDAPWYVSL